MRVAIFLLFFVGALSQSVNALSKTIIITSDNGIGTLNRALKKAQPNDTFLLKKGYSQEKLNLIKLTDFLSYR